MSIQTLSQLKGMNANQTMRAGGRLGKSETDRIVDRDIKRVPERDILFSLSSFSIFPFSYSLLGNALKTAINMDVDENKSVSVQLKAAGESLADALISYMINSYK